MTNCHPACDRASRRTCSRLESMARRCWVNRVEFESWWLMNALRSDMYHAGYCNATSNGFYKACGEYELEYAPRSFLCP